MRPPSQMKWQADPNFATFKIGGRELVIRRDLEPHAARIMQRLNELRAATEPGEGNRQSGFRIMLDDGVELFARRCRRGGMVASLLGDVYVGITPRPLDELGVTLDAMRRGIPVAEPMGAMVEWIGPALYRGFFLTRAVRGMTLWEFVRTDDDATVRRHVLEQARASIATMHDKGLFHADLNLHNLIVTRVGESFVVMIIDLDKARLFEHPLSPAMRHNNIARLMRSAHKLDPSEQFLDAAALSILNPE
ncbi:MAG TPA: lipopolysaccharide kinase InaA family protein [Patescibacteria group bacterium]|nr:lipopolysaccharide kinase InaA family protein [Patescibacteria group bacterium]